LSEYILDENGFLFEEVVEREYVEYSKEERKGEKVKPWNIFKDVKEISRTTKKIDYHGVLTFYCVEKINEKEQIWVDFEAFFIYGKIDKLLLKSFQKHEVKSNDDWIEKQKLENKKLKNRIKKLIGWKFFWIKVANLLSYISGIFSKAQMLIFRYVI
jgi:predicted RNA-binding protein